jgi:hypothetical protein
MGLAALAIEEDGSGLAIVGLARWIQNRRHDGFSRASAKHYTKTKIFYFSKE